MTIEQIQQAIKGVEEFYQETPPGPQADTPATAIIESGLRCRIESPEGNVVYTDMPQAVGGGETTNSPGWLCRAALASCDATLLAMRAAREGIQLDAIEVQVEAKSDGRGMFLDDGVSPGSTEIRIIFNLDAPNAPPAQVRELVDWVVEHSPVGCDITRGADVRVEIKGLA